MQVIDNTIDTNRLMPLETLLMKKLTLTFAFLCAACAFTFAGAPERYQSKEPVVELPTCAQFGGFNVGLNVGGAMLDSTWNDNDNWVDNFSNDFNTSNPTKRREGVTVGGTLGYSWQRGCALFGFIADGSWTSIDGTASHTPTSDPDGTVLRIHDDLNFWGTARARSGVIVDNLLLYVTGGFVFADIDHHWSVDDPNPQSIAGNDNGGATPTGEVTHEAFSADSFRWGGVAGFGAEWSLNDRWSVRSEYLYAFFAEEHTSGFSQAGSQQVHFDTQDTMAVAQICVIYRFGGK